MGPQTTGAYYFLTQFDSERFIETARYQPSPFTGIDFWYARLKAQGRAYDTLEEAEAALRLVGALMTSL